MKVAIVHDDLMRRGGAEQVVLSMLKVYPEADLFTLAYRADHTYPEFRDHKVKTSLYNIIAFNEYIMKWLFFPTGWLCMKMLRVKGYDLVLISNTYCAKYVNIDKKAKVFMYTHTPFRFAWNPTSYVEYNRSGGLKRKLYDLVIKWLRKIDRKEAQKGDYFIGITKEAAQRISEAYLVDDVAIINPPVKCENFYLAENPTEDYYLLVSRFEFYKKVDVAIAAFNKMKKKLIIVGKGSREKELRQMAGETVEFLSGVSKETIADLFANCKAFIFPQHEDYGITPLEANAAGRPVIAYGDGGVLETQIPYTTSGQPFTAVFFKEQTADSLIAAVEQFEKLKPDPVFIRNHAEKFGEPAFMAALSGYITPRLGSIEYHGS